MRIDQRALVHLSFAFAYFVDDRGMPETLRDYVSYNSATTCYLDPKPGAVRATLDFEIEK